MRRIALAALLALALTAPARADPPPPGAYVDSESGAALYGGNCSICHGSRGEGLANRGPSLRGVGARAADFYLRTGLMPLRAPDAQPSRSHVLFGGRQIAALVQYVASLGGPPVPTPHPERGDLGAGMRLFTDHCAGCHQAVAEGGYATDARVPPLKQATATQIAEAVRIGPYVMPRFSERQLDDADLDSIIRYVEYAKRPDDRGGWSIGRIGPVPEGLVTWWIGGVALVALCVLLGRRLHAA